MSYKGTRPRMALVVGGLCLRLAACSSDSPDAAPDAAPEPCERDGLEMAQSILGGDGEQVAVLEQSLAVQGASTMVALGNQVVFSASASGDIQWMWEETGLTISSLDTDANGVWLCGSDDSGLRVVHLDNQGAMLASHALGVAGDLCGQIVARGDALYLGSFSFDRLQASLWRLTTDGSVVWEAPFAATGSPIRVRLDEEEGRIAANVFHAEAPSPRPGDLFLYDSDGNTLWRTSTEGMRDVSLDGGTVWGLGRETLIRFDDQGDEISRWRLQTPDGSTAGIAYEGMAYDGTTLVLVGGASAPNGVVIDRSEADLVTIADSKDPAEGDVYGWVIAWDGTTMSRAILPAVGEGNRLIPKAVAIGPGGDIRVSARYTGTPVFPCWEGETAEGGFVLMQVSPEPIE